MEEQKPLEETLINACGFIRNLQTNQREGKDPTYKFQLRFLDKDDNLVEPDDWYSGFKIPPGVDGDYIVFKYKVNGIYKNIKDVLDVKLTHEEPFDSDKENLKIIKKDIPHSEPEVNNEDEIIVPKDLKLDTPYYALLLVSTINLCIKKGTTSDEEIVAQYNRFIKLVESNE